MIAVRLKYENRHVKQYQTNGTNQTHTIHFKPLSIQLLPGLFYYVIYLFVSTPFRTLGICRAYPTLLPDALGSCMFSLFYFFKFCFRLFLPVVCLAFVLIFLSHGVEQPSIKPESLRLGCSLLKSPLVFCLTYY